MQLKVEDGRVAVRHGIDAEGILTRRGDFDDFAGLVPDWVPQDALKYLLHTETGRSIRALARDLGCHASTVLRQVRRIEGRRDDALVDDALRRLSAAHIARFHPGRTDKESSSMTQSFRAPALPPDTETIEREARRVLRRLAEPGACLAVARDMEKAVVVRESDDGRTIRTAVVDRPVAEAMALKDWIATKGEARITRYHITSDGRAALKRILEEEASRNPGFAESAPPFAGGRPDEETEVGLDDGRPRRIRYNLAESPLSVLSRRRDRDGNPFLGADLVAAGERLREDFELSQMTPRSESVWDRVLAGDGDAAAQPPANRPDGATAARNRVLAALGDLGPGLGDVALRCCCFLEGMEETERRMGWSARSGKIVLRIALQRLRRHYDDSSGDWSPMIG